MHNASQLCPTDTNELVVTIFIHRSHGRWIQSNENVKGKETYTQQSSNAYFIDVAIIIMQKNLCLSDVTFN